MSLFAEALFSLTRVLMISMTRLCHGPLTIIVCFSADLFGELGRAAAYFLDLDDGLASRDSIVML